MAKPDQDKPVVPSLLKDWKPYVIVLCLGILVYGQSLSFDFTYCDDVRDIVEKQELNHGFSKIPLAFKSSFGMLYRPLLRTSWIVDESLGGTSPVVYHASNVLYHLIASALVLLTLLRLDVDRVLAFFAALLFTAHPLLVQAVVWIPGRNDSLLAIFVLLSMTSLVRIMKEPGAAAYALHFLFFVLALFTKETAALFPLVGIYYLWVICKARFRSKPLRILVTGWVVIGVGWLLARHAALAASGQPHTDLTGFDAFLTNLPVLPALVGKAFVPWKLAGLATMENVSVITGLAVIVVLIAICLLMRKIDYKMLGLGAVWACAFFLPAMFHRLEHAADYYDYLEHRAYLPMVGLLIVVGEIVAGLGVKKANKAVYIAAASIVVVFAARGMVHSRTFSDRFVFYNKAIENDPSRSNFHSVLGKLYSEQDDYKSAEACFLKAVECSVCNDPQNYYNLSVICKKLEKPDRSLEWIRKAVDLDPGCAMYRFSQGKTYYAQKLFDEAEAAFLETVKLDPSFANAYFHLAGIYEGRGDEEKLIAACRNVLKYDAKNFLVMNILGGLHRKRNEWDEAVKIWRQMLQIQPDHLPAFEGLMQFHLRNGRDGDARNYALEIMRRGGQLPEELKARMNLQ